MKNITPLGFIPARGGSTRLPKKNTINLGGKPLVAHTIEAALNSKCFKEIILSTDDKDIVSIGKKYSNLHIDNRPKYLATNKATALNTVCEYMNRQKLGKFDSIALMLPTCPFRTAKDIVNGFSMLSRDVDSVISVTNYRFPYEMSLSGDKNDKIKPFFDPSPLITGNTRSQDQKEYFHPNGAFYISWWSSILKYKNFFKGKLKSYYMDEITSTDIDTPLDLEMARIIYTRHIQKVNQNLSGKKST